MKRIVLIGLDKVDHNDAISYFCKGIALSLLNYTVDVYYDPSAEELAETKSKLIQKAFPKVILHPFDGLLNEDLKRDLDDCDFIIVSPMPYSMLFLEHLSSLNKHIYFDLAGLKDYKEHYMDFAKHGFLVYIDSGDIELMVSDVMRKIINDKAEYACVFDLSGSILAMDDNGIEEFITLFVEPTHGNFFFLASLVLAGIIYALENGYNISEALKISTILVSIITRHGADSISEISEESLLKRYHEEFPSI